MAPTSSFTVRQKQNAFEEVAPLQASSSASTPKPPCDVFINHCGQDVKHTLATDIYNRLNSQGLNVCLDERWLEAGDEITSELRTAMETASVHIAIFSKNYACSPWCLAELSFMRKTGGKIIPVFYGVEPSNLRWVVQGKGEYANAFEKYELKGRYSSEKLVEWRTALHKISFITGYVVKSKDDERALLEDIVRSVLKTREEVRRALRRMYHDNEAVGIDHKITEVVNLLEWDNDKPAVAVVLYGIGGAGKTTLANEVYASLELQGWKHSKVNLFKYLESHPNIEKLQSQILQDLTGIKDTVTDSQIGQHKLKSVIEREDVFIYIDNIDKIEYLENLLPKQITNPKRVRILATARTTNALVVFESCGIERCKQYAIDSLPREAALQVLVRKIKKGREIKSIVEERPQAIQIAETCSCCPLFLEVVGGYLLRRKNEVEAYERVIRFLQHGEPFSSNKEYSFDEKRIMFAYQQLEPSAQEAFLDICSYFYDWEWDDVECIVGEEDMKCLEDGALIKRIEDTDHNDKKKIKINIHDLLLQVGRNKSKDNRLTTRDELTVALQNEKLSQIKGIWLWKNLVPEETWVQFHISSEELDKMSGSLRVFSMGNSRTTFHVKGKCSKSFDKLRFLDAIEVPNLPFDIQKLTHLTYLGCRVLEHDTNLSRVKNLSSLKVLKVSKPSGSLNMNGIGEYGNSVKLRQLVLERFHQTEISRSLVNLNSLQELQLIDCSDLNELPESLVKLLSLQELSLCRCERLEQLPAGFGKLDALTTLDLSDCCSLEKLPVDFGELSSLQYLNLSGCSELHVLPESLGSLPSLNHLKLRGCKKLTSLPYSLGSLPSLNHLELRGCKRLTSLPHSLGQLTSLLPSYMSLKGCSSLRELPQEISWLATCKRIYLRSCSSLKMIPNGFSNLICLEKLDMSGCRSLSSLPDGFGKLANLRLLNLSDCDQLKKLCSDFHCLAALEGLNLFGCSSLSQLPDCFGQLGCLKELNLSKISSLSQLPDCFGQLGCLKKLDLSKCFSLSQLPDCFGQLGCLEKLDLSKCFSLSQLPDCFGQLGCLKKLDLSKCFSLSQLPDCFGQLGCLEKLNLSKCSSLSQLPDCFGQLSCLKKLDLSACRSLEKLCHDFHRLPSLIALSLLYCEKLGVEWMDKLGDIPNLWRVDIRGNKMEIHQWVKRKRKENKCNFVANIDHFYPERTAEGRLPLILEAVILKVFDKERLLVDTQDRPFDTSSLQQTTPLVLIIDGSEYLESSETWKLLGKHLQWLEANSKLAFQIIYVSRRYNALTSVLLLLRDRILAYTPHTSGTSSFLENLFSTFPVAYEYIGVFRSSGDGLGGGLKCLSAWEDISYAINEVTFLTRTPRESNIELLRELLVTGETDFLLLHNNQQEKLKVDDLKGKVVLLLTAYCPISKGLFSVLEDVYAKMRGSQAEVVCIPRPHQNRICDEYERDVSSFPWPVVPSPWLISEWKVQNLISHDSNSYSLASNIVVVDEAGKISCEDALPKILRWGLEAYPFSKAREEELIKEEWEGVKCNSQSSLEFVFQNVELVQVWVKEVISRGESIFVCVGPPSKMFEFASDLNFALVKLENVVRVLYVGTSGYSFENEEKDYEMKRKEMCSITSLSSPHVYKFWVRITSLLEELSSKGVDEKTVQVRRIVLGFVNAQLWSYRESWQSRKFEGEKGKGIRIMVVDGKGEMISWSGKEVVQLLCQSDEEEHHNLLVEMKSEGFSKIVKERWRDGIHHPKHDPQHPLVELDFSYEEGIYGEGKRFICSICSKIKSFERYRCSVCEMYEMCRKCCECWCGISHEPKG